MKIYTTGLGITDARRERLTPRIARPLARLRNFKAAVSRVRRMPSLGSASQQAECPPQAPAINLPGGGTQVV